MNVGGNNIFALDGAEKPTLRLVRGQTVTDVSDALPNATHPIGFFDGATAYTTGVTVNGTEGQAGATVTFQKSFKRPCKPKYVPPTARQWAMLLQQLTTTKPLILQQKH